MTERIGRTAGRVWRFLGAISFARRWFPNARAYQSHIVRYGESLSRRALFCVRHRKRNQKGPCFRTDEALLNSTHKRAQLQ